jgi:hypothetical protein
MSIIDRLFMDVDPVLAGFRQSESAPLPLGRVGKDFSPFFGQQKPNGSADAVAQRRLHCGTGLQGAKDVNGGDGFAR